MMTVKVQPIVAPADGLDIVLVRFSPGARTYLHTHHVAQVLHCTEGRGILATKTQQNLVEPGDIVFVPPVAAAALLAAMNVAKIAQSIAHPQTPCC